MSKHKRGCGADRKRRRNRLFVEQGGLCHWCSKPMREDVGESHPDRVTLDHVVPVAKGGGNALDNLVAACFACNQERKNEMPEMEFSVVRASLADVMPSVIMQMRSAS